MRIRSVILAVGFLLLCCLAARAGEPYFCTFGNRTLYYERSDAASGRLRRTTTLAISSVQQTGDGRQVSYTFQLGRPSGAPLYGGPAPMRVEIGTDGTVRMDLGATLKAVLANLFPRAEMQSAGTTALLPPDMRPGDALPEAHCTVEVLGTKYRIDVTERRVLRTQLLRAQYPALRDIDTERRVLRTEQLRVPAGTFDCVVVREHKLERGPGRHRDTISDSWYVPGIGYVRHDTYDKNLRLETTEVLKKY